MKKTVINFCVALIFISNILFTLHLFGIWGIFGILPVPITYTLWVYAIPYVIFSFSLLFFYLKND